MSTEMRVETGLGPVRPVSAVEPTRPNSDAAAASRDPPNSLDSVPPAVPKSAEPELQQAIVDLKDYIQSSFQRELKFSIDKDSGRTVVRVIDPENGETIRQIPAEEVLAIEQSLRQTQGLLFNGIA